MRPDRGTTPDMTSSSIRTVPRDDSYGDGGITRVGGGSAIALPPTHSSTATRADDRVRVNAIHSLKYVPRREREQVARDLKPIYTAIDADAAQQALEDFDEKWGKRFPVITQSWLSAWEYVIPFLAFPPEVRRVIYTTNAIEALNRQLRKAIKTKGHFPNEDAARKLIYLALTNAVPQWTRIRNWTTALLAFKIHFGDRLPDTEN
jgi:transposase-like protein